MKNEVQKFCEAHGLTEAQFYGREKYKGSLDLRSVTSLPENFSPAVGGYLDLSSLTALPENFSPAVGGGLDLSSVTSLPENFSPNCHDYIFDGRWHNSGRKNGHISDCGRWIVADRIVTEIVSKRGNVYKVRKIASEKIIYLVTDGEYWAHGETLQEAKSDLRFKRVGNPDNFRHLTMDSVLPVEDAIAAYRGITGACSAGVRMFMQEIKPKKSYTIAEICDVTRGRFGNETFKSFFKQ